MFIICIWLASEPVVGFVDHRLRGNKILLWLLGRLRTYVLAWGTVSLWRCFWLFWDEFLGGSTVLSAGLGHVISLFLLTAMGCASSINAPASTLGVDSIPHPECEDEPLFSVVPLPWETLYAFGMFRQVDKSKVDDTKRFSNAVRPVSTGNIEMIVGKDANIPEHVDDEVYETSHKKEASPMSALEQSWNPFDPSEANGDDVMEKEESSMSIVQQTWKNIRPGLSNTSDTDRSWRPGLPRSDRSSFLDIEKPSLRRQRCSDYAQRPNQDNKRHRSVFFRSR